ncbi:MAG: helix-turn-helix domain-containing protein [Pseudomonas sp.]
MSLRQAFADALKFARRMRGLSQLQISGSLDASYISRLEAAQSSVTVEASDELAHGLNLEPLSLLSLAYAAEQNLTPKEVLQRVTDELKRLALLDVRVARDTEHVNHAFTAKGAQTTLAVQELKREGHNQAEVARRLGLSTSTVGRHWSRPAK